MDFDHWFQSLPGSLQEDEPYLAGRYYDECDIKGEKPTSTGFELWLHRYYEELKNIPLEELLYSQRQNLRG